MSDALQRFLTRELGGTQLRLTERPALEHQSNRLYDAWLGARHMIVKEFLIPDEIAEAPVREYQALQRLVHLDIAPHPVMYVPAKTLEAVGPLVVYDYMEGEMWDRRSRNAADLAALAAAWHQMNSIPVDGMWLSRGQSAPLRTVAGRIRLAFEAYAAWATHHFPAGLTTAHHCLSLVEKCMETVASLDACEPVLCFCRADPRFANVIGRADGRVGLVDWEDCGLRDPARDLADAVTHANQEDIIMPELWKAFLHPYFERRAQIDPGLQDRMHLYAGLFPIHWLARQLTIGVDRARSGGLANWSINGQPPNWRLRRYLARADAWPKPDFFPQLEDAQDVIFFQGVD